MAQLQPGVAIGGATHCPVSGALFEVTEDSPSKVFEGETYYFCCGACVAYFNERPRTVIERRRQASR